MDQRNRVWHGLCFGLFVLLVWGCVSTPSTPDYPTDPVFHLSSYDFDPGSSLISRVQDVPSFVLSYLEEGDGRDYRNYVPTAWELQLIEEYLELLPGRNRAVLQDRLVGIYFLDTFVGGGLTEYVLSEDDEIYTFMTFNARTLHESLSEWITYRESTVFSAEAGWELQVECGNDYAGFLHVLLHESTHVVDYVEGTGTYLHSFVPSQSGPREAPPGSEAFLHRIWRDPFRTRRSAGFPNRSQVTYYGLFDGPHLPLSAAPETYAQLQSSPFASLYGSLSPWEDLAELVAWHHIINVLGQPFCITVIGPNSRSEFDMVVSPSTPERAEVLGSFY